MKFSTLTILIMISTTFTTLAQDVVHVAEKTVEKTISTKKGDRLEIKVEKATLIIKKSNDDNIKAKIVLVAKNTDKAIATRDLGYLKYVMDRDRDMILIANSFFVPDEIKKITSSMLIRLELEVPSTVEIKTTGRYSDITTDGVTGNFSLYFGSLDLKNTNGSTYVFAQYTDVTGENVLGKCKIICLRSDITISFSDIGDVNHDLKAKTIEVEDGQLDKEVDRKGRFQNFKHKSSSSNSLEIINTLSSIKIQKIKQ